MGLFGIFKGIFKVGKKVLSRKGKNKGKGIFGIRKLFRKKHKSSPEPIETTDSPFVGPPSYDQWLLQGGNASPPTQSNYNQMLPGANQRTGFWDVANNFLNQNQASNESGQPIFDLSRKFKLPGIEVDHEIGQASGGMGKIALIIGAIIAAIVFLPKLLAGKKRK